MNFQEGVVIKLGCCANIEDLALGSSRIMVHAYGQKYCCSRYLGTDAAVKACFISLPISSPAPGLGRNPAKAAKRGCYFPLFLTIQLPISGWFPPRFGFRFCCRAPAGCFIGCIWPGDIGEGLSISNHDESVPSGDLCRLLTSSILR